MYRNKKGPNEAPPRLWRGRQEGEGARRPLSLWITPSLILAPEDGARSMYFDKSTPAGRNDTAGVTCTFSRNPALSCRQRGCERQRGVFAALAFLLQTPDFLRNQAIREEGRANKGVGSPRAGDIMSSALWRASLDTFLPRSKKVSPYISWVADSFIRRT